MKDELDREWLTDMLDYAGKAVAFLGGRDEAALASDEKTLLAVAHALQVVGEAASRVSPHTRAAISEVRWVQVIGMRHRLVHGYRARSVRLIVQTVREDVPVLVASLEAVLRSETP